jgi:hypothetical protein
VKISAISAISGKVCFGWIAQMPVDPIFETVFKEIYGKPCWLVKRGHGSFLTFEFGDPHLEIREPEVPKENVTGSLRQLMRSRKVFIHGDWHLWIYCCAWKVFRGKELVGDSSAKVAIRHAANFLDGQKLVGFSLRPYRVQCAFEFDLGGRLETRPYDRQSEQWLFYDHRPHMVLTLRADGYYQYGRSDVPPAKNWTQISN